MGKGKPRHNPDKPQNKYGSWCSACDEIDGVLYCEVPGYGKRAAKICKGNRHNCCKVEYANEARKSDIRKINDYK